MIAKVVCFQLKSNRKINSHSPLAPFKKVNNFDSVGCPIFIFISRENFSAEFRMKKVFITSGPELK